MKPNRFLRYIKRIGGKALYGAVLAALLLGASGCQASGAAQAALQRYEAERQARVEDAPADMLTEATQPYLWLVDDTYTLSAGYEPERLLEIAPGVLLADVAAEAWFDLLRGMNLDDVRVEFTYMTGFVPYEDSVRQVEQAREYYMAEGYSQARAEKFAVYDCGKPGANPFQTGMILQVRLPGEAEDARKWLSENAALYGFLLEDEGDYLTFRMVGEWHALAMRTLGEDLLGYLRYLDDCGSYTVLSSDYVYRVELLNDLSLSSGAVLAVCGDNRGNYIVITRVAGD